MTRAEILNLIQEAAKALDDSPETPAQWTEDDRKMLREVHASATKSSCVPVAAPEPVAPPANDVPFFKSVPSMQTPAPKKSFWSKLGTGMKTALAGIAFGAGGGALGAVVEAVKDGNVNAQSLAATAAIAAVTGAVGYYQKGPQGAPPAHAAQE
jgi:hypothetical protein